MPAPESGHCVSVVLHDVAPETWPRYAALMEVLDAWRIPLTLLVVPWWHGGRRMEEDRAFRAAMDARLARGDELALHGWRHLDEAPPPRSPRGWVHRRLWTAGEGEFATLSAAECRARIDAGLAAFARCGWPVHGFVAPAWLLGNGAWAALSDFDLRYTSDRDALFPLPAGRPMPAPSLVASARSATRARLSGAWNRARLARCREAALLRVGLHPADMARPSLRDFWLRTIHSLLAVRRPVTKAAWCSARVDGAG